MAEPCTLAFGRYLKMLRERRGFSLEEVASRSRSLADPVEKGYLSRCENGRHGAGFSKIITLARVYEVPIEVLAERLELDMELDRIGGPDTKGLSYQELQSGGAEAMRRGVFWDAYGWLRDASALAPTAGILPGLRDRVEQTLCSLMNVSSAAANLGRSRFALHELEFIHSRNGLGPVYHAVLLERLSTRYRAARQLSKARQLCERAISEAVQQGEVSYIGYLYSTRGRIADDEGDVTSAIAFYRQAYDAYNAVGRHSECAVALHNIAQGYFDLKRYGAVRRTIATVMRLASKHKRERTQALAKTLLGEVEFAEGKRAEAMRHWTEAIDIAKRLNDKILQFRAEFPMYRAAVKLGDDTLARSLQRRLRRLSAWVPPDVGELLEFRELSSQPNRRPPE